MKKTNLNDVNKLKFMNNNLSNFNPSSSLNFGSGGVLENFSENLGFDFEK